MPGFRLMLSRVSLWAAFGATAAGAGSIKGVVYSKGKPVPGARLTLAFNPGGLGGIETRDSTVCDSLGRYAFRGLKTGHWHLSAAAAGFAAGNASAEIGDSGDEAVADLLLRAGPQAAKTGGVTGVIRDAKRGAALKDAKVFLEKKAWSPAQAPLPPRAVDSARSDGQGRYAFDSLDFQGEYIVAVSAPGREPAADSEVSAAIQQTLTRSFDLQPAAKAPARKKK